MTNFPINRLVQSGVALLLSIMLTLPISFANAQSQPPPPNILIAPAQVQNPSFLECIPNPDNPDIMHCQTDERPLSNTLPETNHDGFFLRIYPVPSSAEYNYKSNIIEPDPFTDYKLRVFPTQPQIPDVELLPPRFMP